MGLGLSDLQYLFLIIVVFALTMIVYSNIHHHHHVFHGSESASAGDEQSGLSKRTPVGPPGKKFNKHIGGSAGVREEEKDVHQDLPDKDVAILPGLRKYPHIDNNPSEVVQHSQASHQLKTYDTTNMHLPRPPARPRIHAVTYASHSGRDDRFCRAVESAVRNKFDLIILGWGVPWRGLSQKLEAAHAFAKSLPSEDIILFTDAFDVLFTGNSEEIVDIFVASNASVVFSAECGCWPHVIENGGRDCFQRYPESPTPYRYLNSGTWIGYAAPAAEMLAVVMKEAGANFANANDQKLMADLFMSKRMDIQLDYYNSMFQSMHMTLDPPLKRCNPVEDLQYDSVSKRWVNRVTQGKPAVIHFNGGGKRVHLPMEAKSWYKAPEANTDARRRELKATRLRAPLLDSNPHRTLAFEDICKDYLSRLQ